MSEQHSYVYSRVSSVDQVENSSLDEQILRCVKRAAADQDSPVGVYREEGESGTTEDRTAWQHLMAECRAGRVKTVYALNWKRLARSSRVGLAISEELQELGVGLVVIEADFDTTTPTGRLMQHQMIGFAAFDRDCIVEQMARGQHAMAARNGWPSGGASPYGYRATGGKRTNTLVPHAEEAATIVQMIDWIVDEGLTTGQVARRLNALGKYTRHGKEWSHSNLRRILRQRVLLGEIVWGGSEPAEGRKYKSYKPKGYGEPKHLRFTPLITPERFSELQLALDVRATGPKANCKTYALAGRLVSECGVNYGGVFRADRHLRQYRCRNAQWTATGTPRCGHPRLMADDIEDRVWQAVTALLSDRQRLLTLAQDYLAMRVTQVGVEEDELTALRARVFGLERQATTTLTDLMNKGWDADDIDKVAGALRVQLSSSRRRLAEVEAWALDSRAESARVMSVWQLAETAQERLVGMTTEQRSKVFAILDVRVRVLDGGKQPALRIEGQLCHEKLLDRLQHAGDHDVAGTPPVGPRRR